MKGTRLLKQRPWTGRRQRAVSALTVLCLLLSYLNLGSMVTYAIDNDIPSFRVGETVVAVLADGVLTLSGQGDTDDFEEKTAPFAAYAQDIHALVIEDGITYIGAYLFYGLGGLGGELVLPGSIVGFGARAFSGPGLENAPHFTSIYNEFVFADVARPVEQDSGDGPDTPPPEPEEKAAATPPVAESPQETPGVSAQPETEQTAPESTPGEDAAAESGGIQAEDNGTRQSAPDAPESSPLPPEAVTPVQGAVEPILNKQTPAQPESDASASTESLSAGTEQTEQDASGGVPAAPVESPAPSTAPEPSPSPATPETVPPADTGADCTESPDLGGADPGYIIETITKQELAFPATLFYEGQSGVSICSAENTPFIQAALSAGYQIADGLVQVTLDNQITLETPVVNGQICLPDCPAEVLATHAPDVFFTYEFVGWSPTPDDGAASVFAPGEFMEAAGADALSLYSIWIPCPSYQLQVKVDTDGGAASYTLLDGNTGEAPRAPEGFVFSCQWQIAQQSGEEPSDWTNIDGADDTVYQRPRSDADSGLLLRCGVTAVQLTRTGTAAAPTTVYTEPVSAATQVHTVYVNSGTGSDNNDGSKEYPVKTLEQASEIIKDAGGTSVETNEIIIMSDYLIGWTTEKEFVTTVPVTLSGETGKETLTVFSENSSEMGIFLAAPLRLQNLKLSNANHIYANGYDITIGTGVNAAGLYLYGAAKSAMAESCTVGNITVLSGSIARIIGYVRSQPHLDAGNQQVVITVGGTANVANIMAGSASGAVKNADVTINITGGTVTNVVGGNHGFSNADSPYAGKTTINISGGTVERVLGAGMGRDRSVPTFEGDLNINVTGGKVNNLYGAGSAAYVISSNHELPSSVNISITGGEVENAFAAGQGWQGDLSITADAPTCMDFGSVTGNVNITVGGSATVKHIYASGEGVSNANGLTQSNAYLDGSAVVTLKDGATITGNIYGGGKGISTPGYEECARVTESSSVKVLIQGGVVKGNVFGGGAVAKVEGSSYVELSGGTVEGRIYGGGEKGLVEGKTTVVIRGGIVNSSVYGGALGISKDRLVLGGSTINMTGGWVKGNLYGGSELSDDGPQAGDPQDIVFVNLAGGTVSGNVFGGGYQGVVNGSTHLHIGVCAPADCKYYQVHPEDRPSLTASALVIDGSVYAGGDYGGDTVDYTTITVEGTSHVYIDGTGYNTGGAGDEGKSRMNISEGVFGSGASCDAGSTRLVTLKNYGSPVKDSNGFATGATRTLAAIQRADRVLLNNTHVQLTGQSDVANPNQTTLYSLNRIGDYGPRGGVAAGENALALQGGSTLLLNSAVIETANFISMDAKGTPVALDGLQGTPNTICFDKGTVFRVSSTQTVDGVSQEIYGAVSGWAYMLAGETADAYAYARVLTDAINTGDGGFVGSAGSALGFTNVGTGYRYWKLSGASSVAERYTVLTAQTLESSDSGFGVDGFSVATGSIELPPTAAGESYTIRNVTLPTGTDLVLVDAARNALNGTWASAEINAGKPSSDDIVSSSQQDIRAKPLSTFGLFMRIGSGFSSAEDAPGRIVSNKSALAGGENSIIGQQTVSTSDGGTPYIEFYLTYLNEGITASKRLGTVMIELTRSDNTTTIMNVEIVTKARKLTDQTVELYATQSGSYTGSLVIPSGDSRALSLTAVAQGTSNLVSVDSMPSGHQFSIAMQPEKSQAWNSEGLMQEAYDLSKFSNSDAVSIGKTDSRFEAGIQFTLKTTTGFEAKDTPDQVVLTLTDGSDSSKITLNIHWKNSAVSNVYAAPGRVYSGLAAVDSNADIAISQKSALTAAFCLSGATNTPDLWLELQGANGAKVDLPAGTRLTLSAPSGYYQYEVASGGAVSKLGLDKFKKMWDTGTLSGLIAEKTTLTVIVDFGLTSNSFSAGDYSLRLRTEQGADSQGAGFTFSNADMAVSLSDGGGSTSEAHSFILALTANNDTRVKDGAAVVLYLEDGSLPTGASFSYDGKTYYPSNGKVYLPLVTASSSVITMDISHSTGLAAGTYALKADIFPVGQSAGSNTAIAAAVCSFDVAARASYGLYAALSGGMRTVKAGDTLDFTITYSVDNPIVDKALLKIGVLQKTGPDYVADETWAVPDISISSSLSTTSVTIQVPAKIAPGTYRLVFELGSEKTPYNIIVL